MRIFSYKTSNWFLQYHNSKVRLSKSFLNRDLKDLITIFITKNSSNVRYFLFQMQDWTCLTGDVYSQRHGDQRPRVGRALHLHRSAMGKHWKVALLLDTRRHKQAKDKIGLSRLGPASNIFTLYLIWRMEIIRCALETVVQFFQIKLK